jgi:hypothetical protein
VTPVSLPAADVSVECIASIAVAQFSFARIDFPPARMRFGRRFMMSSRNAATGELIYVILISRDLRLRGETNGVAGFNVLGCCLSGASMNLYRE